jgi:murein DD-endopeptidase MepM/ murein hydrolase activator NlpD
MRTFLALVFLSVVVALGVLWWVKFEHEPPTAVFVVQPEVLGRKTPLDVRVRAGSNSLRSAVVRLRVAEGEKQGAVYDLVAEAYPPTSWRGSGVIERELHIEAALHDLEVPEGPAALEVFVETHAWHLWTPPMEPRLAVPISVDLTPPRVEILSAPHNMRLGGADLAVFRQSPDTVRSGIAVGESFFPSTAGLFSDESVALAMFAAPQDRTGNLDFQVVAVDGAGNERRAALPVRVKVRTFAARTLPISDGFLERKVPEIIEANRLRAGGSLVEQYLYINRELRLQNEKTIREITAASHPLPLWDGVFMRQPNAAPLSSFADRRTYEYQGQVIDHQTHLGFDLASTKLAPVVASQNGIVVFADNLGIYGNAVVLDHGLGIFSLYAHLSTTAVHKGDRVTTGQTIGQTGETGLAGGDHLHFSVILYGQHVDPIEWWDPHWLQDHVTARLDMLPRSSGPTAEVAP